MSVHNLSRIEQHGVVTKRLQTGEEFTKEGWFSLDKTGKYVNFRRNRGRGYNRNNGGEIGCYCFVSQVVNFEKTKKI